MSVDAKTSQARRFTDESADKGTTIAVGTHIKGTLTGATPLDISGTIEGGVDVDALVWVRPDGHVKGEISARALVVEGQLNARLDIRERVELRATSRVHGDLSASAIAIADGALYEGHVEMPGHGGERKGTNATHFREKREPGG